MPYRILEDEPELQPLPQSGGASARDVFVNADVEKPKFRILEDEPEEPVSPTTKPAEKLGDQGAERQAQPQTPAQPQLKEVTDPALLRQLEGDDNEQPKPGASKMGFGDYAEDVAKSAVYRGLPEALFAATPLGMGLNLLRGGAEAGNFLVRKAAEKVTGEEIPQYNEIPIPWSSEALQYLARPFIYGDMYEPKTTPGQYANTVTQFAVGGGILGAPLKATVPAAVASETGGQLTAGTEYEPAARIGGALLGGIGAGVAQNKFAQKPMATSDDIKRIANQKYAEVEKMGVQLPAEVTNKYIDGVKSTLLSNDDLINSMKSNKPLRDAFDDIALFKDQPMTLSRAQALDEQIGNMIDSHTTLGQVNKVGKKLIDAQHQLRNMVDENFATPALKEARHAWSAQAKLRDIERIMQRAETMDNPATAIKTGFRQLLTNPNKSKWYTRQELKLIERAAKSGVVGDTLRTMGSRLIPIIDAGTGGGLASTAVATAGSMASRGMATQAQINRAMKLSDQISKPYAPPRIGANTQMLRSIDQRQVFPELLDNLTFPNNVRKRMGLLERSKP